MSQPPPPQQPEGWGQPNQPGQPEQPGQPDPYAPQAQQGWGPVQPHPSGTTSEERNWAVAAHAGSFVAAYVLLGVLAPLIVLLTKGKDSPFIRAHAVESLNFQISALIYLGVSALLIIVLIGIPMLIGVGIFYLIVVIMASVKASEGRLYRYPLTIRMVS